jgi:hypothetical protein
MNYLSVTFDKILYFEALHAWHTINRQQGHCGERQAALAGDFAARSGKGKLFLPTNDAKVIS